jgi:hypothetical protein
MLCELSPRVTSCLKNAAEARRRHRNESDPDKKHTYLQIEQCWYRLADGYALMKRVEDGSDALPLGPQLLEQAGSGPIRSGATTRSPTGHEGLADDDRFSSATCSLANRSASQRLSRGRRS